MNGSKTTHVWDGGYIVMELDNSGSVTDRYVRGIGLIKSDANGYYLFNAHGDVTGLTNVSGLKTKDYRYDAFGVEVNPFRFCGEYFDKETNTIYLRNRYYDQGTSRFLTEDPIREGLNWYTYCGGNPIAFVDPMGLDMKLIGSYEEKQQIYDTLKLLTGDNLSYDTDDLGNWVISYDSVSGSKWNVGTGLVRSIVDNKYTCLVQVTTGGSGANPIIMKDASNHEVGTGGIIYFNPDDIGSVLTEYIDKKGNTGVKYQSIPKEITLGHELIHILHYMGGNFTPYNDDTKAGYGSYDYRDENGLFGGKGKMRTTEWRMEELLTTGISYTSPDGAWVNAAKWYTTENSLRAEHGYGRRVKY